MGRLRIRCPLVSRVADLSGRVSAGQCVLLRRAVLRQTDQRRRPGQLSAPRRPACPVVNISRVVVSRAAAGASAVITAGLQRRRPGPARPAAATLATAGGGVRGDWPADPTDRPTSGHGPAPLTGRQYQGNSRELVPAPRV